MHQTEVFSQIPKLLLAVAFFFFFGSFFFFLPFLGPILRHMEVPRLGGESEL